MDKITNDRRSKIEIYNNILYAISEDTKQIQFIKRSKEDPQTRLTHLQLHTKLSYDSLKKHVYDMKSKGLITIVTKAKKPYRLFSLSITTKGHWFISEFPNYTHHKELLEDSLSKSNTKSYDTIENNLVLLHSSHAHEESDNLIDSQQIINIQESIISELESYKATHSINLCNL